MPHQLKIHSLEDCQGEAYAYCPTLKSPLCCGFHGFIRGVEITGIGHGPDWSVQLVEV